MNFIVYLEVGFDFSVKVGKIDKISSAHWRVFVCLCLLFPCSSPDVGQGSHGNVGANRR